MSKDDQKRYWVVTSKVTFFIVIQMLSFYVSQQTLRPSSEFEGGVLIGLQQQSS